jgi:uncharacterized phage protein gp47/JayE
MATAPQIALPTGIGFTTNLTFTTNESSITITGTVGVNTASIQVSINGAPFVSDPTLIQFVLQTFTIPNPVSYPSGLNLNLGVNTIQIRAIDVVGGVSPISTVTVTRVSAVNQTIAQIPTGIRVVRHTNSVDVLASVPPANATLPTLSFVGFNYYASQNPGGATTGYFQVNQSPVSASTEFVEDDLGTLNDTAAWTDQFHKNVRIRVTDVDDFGNELAVQLDSIHDVSSLSGQLRFSSTLVNFQFTNFVVFNFNRDGSSPNTINADQFNGVAATDPLYFVVTAVYFDSATNTKIETPHSQEVLGTPLIIDTTIRDLPGRTQVQIVTAYVVAVQAVNTQISLIPGSISRDVDIDPFSSEAERIWFLIDFIHRSQSFLTLLAVDNVSGSGISDPVSGSAYKQALMAAVGLTQDAGVQSLIDQQFDKLAGNVATTRLPGRAAVGTEVIYTLNAPTTDLIIPAGTQVTSNPDPTTGASAQTFVIGGSYTLPAANAQAFYNFSTKRYEIIAQITAVNVGSAGNLPAGAITNIIGVAGVSVINENATVFGDDQETNHDLAERAILSFSAVDTGTEGGYAKTAASQVGIIKAEIVKSGDPLMFRDYDPVRMKHIGGKVDVWVQGTLERQVTDVFAFTFSQALGVQCQIINVTTLTFQVLDSRVTPTTPLIEILNNPSQNLGVFNVTLGQAYDLTGVQIISFNEFQLNTTIPQPVTHLDDIVTADYRFQVADKFIFTLQPVLRVVSVIGEVSGSLTPTNSSGAGGNYTLFRADDPLLNGNSTIAQNYLTVVQFNGIPTGNTIPINNETHVLIGFQADPLNSVGINTATIVVYDVTRTITYKGPGTASPDYALVPGTPTTPVSIVRTPSSTIPNGATVSVDYVHDENFTVTYVINDLLQQLQQVLNKMRHVTADVLAKQTVDNNVNIETTVQLSAGASQANVDPNIRTAVSIVLDTKTIGEGVAQSNVDSAINNTSGVAFNVLPMALMGYADGSQRLREDIGSGFEPLPSLSIGGNLVYIMTQSFEFPTIDSGGPPTLPRGVYQDGIGLTMATSLAIVGQSAAQAWIIGAEGAIIAGYSDDATLISQGVPADQLVATRLNLTANHAVVSLSASGTPPDNPGNHDYSVTYVIFGNTGSQDIQGAQVEYITLGNFTVTYRSATGT